MQAEDRFLEPVCSDDTHSRVIANAQDLSLAFFAHLDENP